MSKVKVPLQQLNKQEFIEAYEEMLSIYRDGNHFDKYPLPTINEVAEAALLSNQISIEKYLEFTK